MEALVEKTPSIHLRRVDIDRWGSPVASQYGIDSLPALYLYEDGELVSKDLQEVWGKLQALAP